MATWWTEEKKGRDVSLMSFRQQQQQHEHWWAAFRGAPSGHHFPPAWDEMRWESHLSLSAAALVVATFAVRESVSRSVCHRRDDLLLIKWHTALPSFTSFLIRWLLRTQPSSSFLLLRLLSPNVPTLVLQFSLFALQSNSRPIGGSARRLLTQETHKYCQYC